MRRWNENLIVVSTLFLAILATASAWDERDGRARAAELKDQAIKWAVEHYGTHEYFASDMHCPLPIQGQRLIMQAASPRDPGKGYRCTYYVLMQPPEQVPVAFRTWSRSPEVIRTLSVAEVQR